MRSALLVTILLVLIGLSFIAWGIAQMMFILPFYSNWSDVAGLAMGITTLMMAFMAYTDLQTVELRA